MFRNVINKASVSPMIAARSIYIGSVIAFTPTFGLQMPMVAAVWGIFRSINALRFNLAIGLAMTWLTNHFTIVPYYFLSYICGAQLLELFSGFHSPFSYNEFTALLSPLMQASLLDSFHLLTDIFYRIGLPLVIGTLPFIAIVPPVLSVFYLKLAAGKKDKMRARD